MPQCSLTLTWQVMQQKHIGASRHQGCNHEIVQKTAMVTTARVLLVDSGLGGS
jgi:hypothetical protein